jgi:hypothetical protein
MVWLAILAMFVFKTFQFSNVVKNDDSGKYDLTNVKTELQTGWTDFWGD